MLGFFCIDSIWEKKFRTVVRHDDMILSELDLADVQGSMRINGVEVGAGCGRDIINGHPLVSGDAGISFLLTFTEVFK